MTRVVRWPVILFLAVGVLWVRGHDAYNYFFAARTHAVVESCSQSVGEPACYASWTANGKRESEQIEGAEPGELSNGQAVDVYPVGDLGHVRPDSAGPPWPVWLFAAVAVLYLVALGLRTAKATRSRRKARAERRHTHQAGELAVLGAGLGFPLLALGAFLAQADRSHSAGLAVLAASGVALLGLLVPYLALNLSWSGSPAAAPERD